MDTIRKSHFPKVRPPPPARPPCLNREIRSGCSQRIRIELCCFLPPPSSVYPGQPLHITLFAPLCDTLIVFNTQFPTPLGLAEHFYCDKSSALQPWFICVLIIPPGPAVFKSPFLGLDHIGKHLRNHCMSSSIVFFCHFALIANDTSSMILAAAKSE